MLFQYLKGMTEAWIQSLAFKKDKLCKIINLYVRGFFKMCIFRAVVVHEFCTLTKFCKDAILRTAYEHFYKKLRFSLIS